ncbi:MAG: hypothetical protein WC337_06240 [Candidatus Muiribacteriota bacterium]
MKKFKNNRIMYKLFLFFIIKILMTLILACSGKPSNVLYTPPVSLNKPPVITNVRVTENSGDIKILYNIEDAENDKCGVNLYFARGTSEIWTKTQNVSGATTNIIPGNDKFFTWNSSFDITSEATVTLKLEPFDEENSGIPVLSNPFKVDNTGRRVLLDILLSSNNVNISAGGTLNLNSIEVTARYHNMTEIKVDNVLWEVVSGGGDITGNLYQSPSTYRDVELKVSYTENEITKSAVLNVNVYHTLTGIRLEPEKAEDVGGYFDLTTVKVYATYDDGVEKIVIPTNWHVSQGTGSIVGFGNGFVYFTDEAIADDAVLTCVYTEGGVTFTAPFEIEIISDETILAFVNRIYGSNSDMIFDYTVVNPFGVTEKIDFYYSLNGGLTYTKSSNISGDIEGIFSGTHRITWHSDIDISNLQNNVMVKIVPVKGTKKGDGIPSEVFTVDNNMRNLTSIYLSDLSINLAKGSEYNLLGVQVTAVYSDSPIRMVDNVVWRKKSGVGTVNNNIYHADTVGQALLEVMFIEGNQAATADFVVTVGRKLTDLLLDISFVNLPLYNSYDLRNVNVTAVYGDEALYEAVTTPLWTLVGGPGFIHNNIYTSVSSGTAVLEASYTEGNINQKETFMIHVMPQFSHISISPENTQITVGSNYDLSQNIVRINYIDGSSKIASNVTWNHKSGPGLLTGNIFKAHNAGSQSVMTVSYEEGGNLYQGDFIINVKPAPLSLFIAEAKLDLYAGEIYNLNNLTLRVKYDDNSEFLVNADTWQVESGAGSISGSNYVSPLTSGTAYLRARYTETTGLGPITVTAGILVEIRPALQNLTCSVTDYNLDIGFSKNFADFTYYAHYDDGSSRTVTNISYSMFSGSGLLNGSLFTAPLTAGISVIQASFTEGFITKTVNITIHTQAELDTISLSPVSHNMSVGHVYNLANVTVTANYKGAVSKTVLPENWVVLTGPGNISDTLFTATASGQTTLRATYRETTARGVVITRTAVFEINTASLLTHITINPTGRTMAANTTYNLQNVSVTAHYSDGTTQNTTDVTWTIKSGSGTIDGTNFIAPSSQGITVLECSHSGQIAEYTVTVQHKLEYITLSQNEKKFRTMDTFNLDNITVTAHFNDATTENVTSQSVWTKVNGEGSIAGSIYSAPASVSTGNTAAYAVLQASYTENNVEKSVTMQIIIKPDLFSLSLYPSKGNIILPGNYRLKNVNVYANYVNNSSELIQPENLVWTFIQSESGLGKIGLIGDEYYYIPEVIVADTAEIRVRHTSLGQTVSDTFEIVIE